MIKRIFSTLTAIALTTCSAVSAADYEYDHNGSRMRVSVNDWKVDITYLQPRSGLRDVGVRPGTVLFSGSVNSAGNYVEGTAWVFSAKCGPIDYNVRGVFQAGQNFRLGGPAPVRKSGSCRITEKRTDVAAAKLTFTALGHSHPAVATGCIKGVNSSLNVRVGPGRDYGVITQLTAGSCGITVLPRCQDGWCAIKRGRTAGWVATQYLQR